MLHFLLQQKTKKLHIPSQTPLPAPCHGIKLPTPQLGRVPVAHPFILRGSWLATLVPRHREILLIYRYYYTIMTCPSPYLRGRVQVCLPVQ